MVSGDSVSYNHWYKCRSADLMCRKHENTSAKLAGGNMATLDDYQALATSSGEIKSAQTKGTDNLASPDGGELIAASLTRRVSFRGGS